MPYHHTLSDEVILHLMLVELRKVGGYFHFCCLLVSQKLSHNLYFNVLVVCTIGTQNPIKVFKCKQPKAIDWSIIQHTIFKVKVKVKVKMHVGSATLRTIQRLKLPTKHYQVLISQVNISFSNQHFEQRMEQALTNSCQH